MPVNFDQNPQVVNPQGVTEADIAIFILSNNDEACIEMPVRKAGLGLQKFYPNLSAVVVNCDDNSTDGTREAFFAAECEIPRIQITSAPKLKGRGAAIRNIFPLAASLKAKVTMIFDADLTSIKTTWIETLAAPILAGHADYITPLYVRHQDDAPLTRCLIYPLWMSLYGRRVLQPLAVDHAFSSDLVELYSQQNWELDDVGFKADLKMLSLAIMNKARICQAFMAHPRLVCPKDYARSRLPIIANTIKTAFTIMEESSSYWKNIKVSRSTVVSGVDQPPLNLPPQVDIDVCLLKQLIFDTASLSYKTWEHFLPNEQIKLADIELKKVFRDKTPEFPPEIWRDLVYETALAFRKNQDPEIREALCKSLVPLFLLRRLSLYAQTRMLDSDQAQALLNTDALVFEKGKKLLVDRWPF